MFTRLSIPLLFSLAVGFAFMLMAAWAVPPSPVTASTPTADLGVLGDAAVHATLASAPKTSEDIPPKWQAHSATETPAAGQRQDQPDLKPAEGVAGDPHDWHVSTEFGEVILTLSSEDALVKKVAYDFSDFKCGGVTLAGGIQAVKVGGWPIKDGQVTIETSLAPLGFGTGRLTLHGKTDTEGHEISGDWVFVTPTDTCSGTWKASQTSRSLGSSTATGTSSLPIGPRLPIFPTIPRIPTTLSRVAPTDTPAPAPEVEIKAPALNLRGGPGTDFAILDTLSQGERLSVVGQNGDCTWLQVAAPDKTEGWISGAQQYVTLSIPCTKIPAGHFRPLTGIIRRNGQQRGLGELLIKNGTDADGLVILTSLDEQPVMSAYIRAGESFEMTGVPDGIYRLYFSKGEKWDDTENRFTRNASYERFEDSLSFETSATHYTGWEVTLYGVLGGNARSQTVDPDHFPGLD